MRREIPDLSSCRIFGSEAHARAWLVARAWPNGPVCPHCDSRGERRITRLGGRSHRAGLYQCNLAGCRRQFTVTVGTLFADSKIPLHKWLAALFLSSQYGRGVSVMQLHRVLGLSYKSTWGMVYRLRQALPAPEPELRPSRLKPAWDDSIDRPVPAMSRGERREPAENRNVAARAAQSAANPEGVRRDSEEFNAMREKVDRQNRLRAQLRSLEAFMRTLEARTLPIAGPDYESEQPDIPNRRPEPIVESFQKTTPAQGAAWGPFGQAKAEPPAPPSDDPARGARRQTQAPRRDDAYPEEISRYRGILGHPGDPLFEREAQVERDRQRRDREQDSKRRSAKRSAITRT